MLNAHSCIYVRPSVAKVYYFNVNWVLEFKFKKNKHKKAFFVMQSENRQITKTLHNISLITSSNNQYEFRISPSYVTFYLVQLIEHLILWIFYLFNFLSIFSR